MLWIFSLIHRQPLSMSVTVFAVFTLELDHTMSTSTCFRSPYFFFGSLTHNVKCFEWICDGDWNERVCGWLWHQLDGISRHILWITFICVTWFSRQSHHRPRLTCFFFLCQWSTKLAKRKNFSGFLQQFYTANIWYASLDVSVFFLVCCVF